MKINKQASRSGSAYDLMWEVSGRPRSNISYPDFFWMCGFSKSLQLNVRIAFPLGLATTFHILSNLSLTICPTTDIY